MYKNEKNEKFIFILIPITLEFYDTCAYRICSKKEKSR